MKAALAMSGYEASYETVSWARALEGTKNGTYDVVLGATDGELRDAVRPKEEIGVSVNVFFVEKSSPWRYRDISSLRGSRLVVVDGYAYGSPLDEYIAASRNNSRLVSVIGSSDPVNGALRLLSRDKGLVYIDDRVVVRWTAVRSLQGNVREAGEYSRRKLYGLFSARNPKSSQLASSFDGAIREMRHSGALKRILEKYAVSDWK